MEDILLSTSMHVIGFKPPDEKWEKMKAVWDSCDKADMPQPAEVLEFFNYETPDDMGVEVDLDEEEWSDENRQGFQIHLDKIPKDVKIIRFYLNY